jgi:hypothetical protein
MQSSERAGLASSRRDVLWSVLVMAVPGRIHRGVCGRPLLRGEKGTRGRLGEQMKHSPIERNLLT